MFNANNTSIAIVTAIPSNQNHQQAPPQQFANIEIDRAQANQHYHDVAVINGILTWTVKNAINKIQIERLTLDTHMANFAIDNKILSELDHSLKYLTQKLVESQNNNSPSVKISTGLYKSFEQLKSKLGSSPFWNNGNNYSGFPDNFYELLNIPA